MSVTAPVSPVERDRPTCSRMCPEIARYDAEHLGEHVWIGGQQKPQGEGQGKNPLAQRPCGEHFVGEQRRRLGHPPRTAARAKAADMRCTAYPRRLQLNATSFAA